MMFVTIVTLGAVLWLLADLTSAAARPWLWSLAIVMGGLALWLGAREEHWLGGHM